MNAKQVRQVKNEFGFRSLLSEANRRQILRPGYLSVGVTLAPRATGRTGLNLCANATPGCARSCFADHDRMAWHHNKMVAVNRTRLLAQAPDVFLEMLVYELAAKQRLADKRGERLVCRLNVVSDVAYERAFPSLFERFPSAQFMDYTKDVTRVLGEPPHNYHLTFSRSERNGADCERVLASGRNVSVVFRTADFPPTFLGYEVIDGDEDDLRFLDPSPRIVGLRARGKARTDRSGFVADTVEVAS